MKDETGESKHEGEHTLRSVCISDSTRQSGPPALGRGGVGGEPKQQPAILFQNLEEKASTSYENNENERD